MATGVQKNEQKHAHTKHQSKSRACQVAGCKNKYRAKGYCDRHYAMWRRGEFGKKRYRSCSKDDPRCTKPAVKMGLCETHLAEVLKAKAPPEAAAPAAPAAAPAAEAGAEASEA